MATIKTVAIKFADGKYVEMNVVAESVDEAAEAVHNYYEVVDPEANDRIEAIELTDTGAYSHVASIN